MKMELTGGSGLTMGSVLHLTGGSELHQTGGLHLTIS